MTPGVHTARLWKCHANRETPLTPHGRRGTNPPHLTSSVAFYTVTNNRYYAGTIATLSSIRRFYREEPIWVFTEWRHPLTRAQSEHLRALPNVRLVVSKEVPIGTIKEAWQMKAHSAAFLAERQECRCLVQVDSDAVLCAPLDHIVEPVMAQGLPAGGKDGNGEKYDHPKYSPYYELCKTAPEDRRATMTPYVSTSVFFLPLPQMNAILKLWSTGVDEAQFGPKERLRKLYAGYSDQGILNAIFYFKGITPIVLDNNLVSQHWIHGRDKIELKDGAFWNAGKRQIAFHSVGQSPKFWTAPYIDYVAKSGNLTDVYHYWLSNLFDGPCGLLNTTPLLRIEQMQNDYFPGVTTPHLVREYRARNDGGHAEIASPPIVAPA
jgi:hypothetical protein